MTISRHFYAITGLVVVLSAISLSSNKVRAVALAPIQDVRVTNTTAQPVPTVAQGTTQVSGNLAVTGEVAVDGTVDVMTMPAVQIANGESIAVNSLPAVSLSPGTSVAINNPDFQPVNVRDVGPAGRTPFFVEMIDSLGAGVSGATFNVTTVPPGKRLILKDISFWGDAATVTAAVNASAPGNFKFYLPVQAQPGGLNAMGAVTNCSFEFPAGTNIFFFCGRTSSGERTVIATFHGYLENAP